MGTLVFLGCSLFRYQVIPQSNLGPNGGSVVFIDQRIPEYIEFAAFPIKPEDGEWKFKVFSYDAKMNPKSLSRSCYVEIELPDGTSKSINLWNTAPFFWQKGISNLENTIKLQRVEKFIAKVTLKRGSIQETMTFNYPPVSQ